MKDMHSDRDPRPLSDLLRGAVPASPDPGDRAEAVVRRARAATRRRGAVTAAAVGVVAFAVIVVPHLLPSSPVSNDASPGSSLGHPKHGCSSPTQACAPSGVLVPPGAVSVRVVPSQDMFTDWAPPADALTTNADSLASQFNNLPRATKNEACTAEGSTDNYVMTFRYPDGRLVSLHGVGAGCSFVSIVGNPGSTRQGARTLLESYFSDLVHQRAHQQPPAELVSEPACPTHFGSGGGTLIPLGRDLGMTTAVICAFEASRSGPTHLTRSARFTPGQVHAIDQDYLNLGVKHLRVNCHSGAQPRPLMIIGLTAWGDRVVLQSACNAYVGAGLYWQPSAHVAAMIASVIGP